MSRTILAVLCSMIVAVGLAACGKSSTITKTVTHTVTVSPAPVGGGHAPTKRLTALAGTPARQRFDGKNPGPECGYEGELDSPNVHTTSSANLYYPGHHFMGTLLLRQSNLCPSAAGELLFSNLKSGTRIYIRLVRPGKYAKTEPYQTISRLSPTFTAMLANDRLSGCVYAEAWLELAHSGTAPVRTECY